MLFYYYCSNKIDIKSDKYLKNSIKKQYPSRMYADKSTNNIEKFSPGFITSIIKDAPTITIIMSNISPKFVCTFTEN